MRPNQRIVRCNDKAVRTHEELIEETSRHDTLDLHLKTETVSLTSSNEAQDREVRILGDYVYDFFMTLIIICTGETAVIVVLSAIAISNIAVVYSPFLIAFVITALFPRILRIQSYLFLLIFITEGMIILLYIAQLVVLFDDSVLSNPWMIDLLALFGINAGSGKTKDWVSSTRGILPAASLFVFVWHQAFQRQLMYENKESNNLTDHLTQLAQKMKHNEDEKRDEDDGEEEKEEIVTMPRSRKISDVAELLMKQQKKNASKQETRTNVFMKFLITLLTTWRRPLRWTIQVVVYVSLSRLCIPPLIPHRTHTHNTQVRIDILGCPADNRHKMAESI